MPGVRTWVGDAIQEGGVTKWLTGLLIKGVSEVIAAVTLGYLFKEIIFLVFPVSSIELYVGSAGEPLVWLTLTATLAYTVTRCTFDTPSEPDP
ncbi:MAG: hypothetical protein U5J98_09700 [Halobacteriales archaeon]|nr:hypothetical protein [Halobacteriales archaeon]